MQNDDIRITGRFGGHDVDLTITVNEGDLRNEFPVDKAPGESPLKAEGGQDPLEVAGQASGEIVSPVAGTESDPAPEPVPVSEDPPNPAGNAEQL